MGSRRIDRSQGAFADSVSERACADHPRLRRTLPRTPSRSVDPFAVSKLATRCATPVTALGAQRISSRQPLGIMRSSLSVGAAIVRHSIRTVFGGISRNAIGTTIFVMRAGDSGVVNAPLIAAGAFVRFGSSWSPKAMPTFGSKCPARSNGRTPCDDGAVRRPGYGH